MFTVTREFRFEAAHRILGHSGKCRHLHGHSYRTIVTVRSPKKELDASGMVVDFYDLKATVGNWIDADLDHNVILNLEDPIATMERSARVAIIGMRDPFVICGNPTAENIARIIFEAAQYNLPNLQVVSVTVHETENCSATYSPDPIK